MVAAAGHGEVRLWRVNPLVELRRLTVPGVAATCVAFSKVGMTMKMDMVIHSELIIELDNTHAYMTMWV